MPKHRLALYTDSLHPSGVGRVHGDAGKISAIRALRNVSDLRRPSGRGRTGFPPDAVCVRGCAIYAAVGYGRGAIAPSGNAIAGVAYRYFPQPYRRDVGGGLGDDCRPMRPCAACGGDRPHSLRPETGARTGAAAAGERPAGSPVRRIRKRPAIAHRM